MLTTLFPVQVFAGLPFVFVLVDASAYGDPLLRLLLHNAADSDNLLSEVSGLLVIPTITPIELDRGDVPMVVGGPVAMAVAVAVTVIERTRCPFFSLAVDLQLDLLSSQAVFSSTALDPLAALADACPEPATKIGAVARAPSPHTSVGRVIAA